MKKIILLAIMLWFTQTIMAQTTFEKTYGGSSDETGYSIQQTDDEGYILAGFTNSYGAGNDDFYIIKINMNGDTLWTKTFGGSDGERAYSVQHTDDGGYIISGYTRSYGEGGEDFYLVKTDINGDTLWTKTYGGSLNDVARSVKQTDDGGYIITGSSYSFGPGDNDIYLIKTNSLGDTLWTKTFGGVSGEWGLHGQQTSDGGYIITGHTSSYGAGNIDVYLIKTDANGDTLWTETYGGASDDIGESVQQTTDGGYIIVGETSSYGVGDNDLYIIKTDIDGDTLWTKTYGGTLVEWGFSIQQTTDGGYIIAGETSSFGAGDIDIFILKTDADGDTLWTKTYGGIQKEDGGFIIQTTDEGYIVLGSTQSYGAGSDDFYIIKTDENGNKGYADIDGNIYTTVKIGSQTWLKENLRTTKYNDGTPITKVTDNTEWSNLTTEAYCWYDNDSATYADPYGALYNWYAVETEKLCPTGWYVPSDEEWKELEMYLGMSQAEANNEGFRGTNEGSKLAGNGELWLSGLLTDNIEFGTSSFDAIPGGFRHSDEGFNTIESSGHWWSTNEDILTTAYGRIINASLTGICRLSYNKEYGFSVRCLKNNSPDIGIIPDTLDFGTMYTSTTEDSTLSLWIKNTGDADLVIDSVKGLNEPFSHDFTISDTVVPNDSTEIQVTLDRAYLEGLYRDTMFIYSNAIDTFIVVKSVLEETDTCCPAAVMDFDGNVYPTVKIGSQCWLKENLKSTKYNDGTAITNVTDNTEWSNLTTEAYCWYDNDSATYSDTYGALYNWYAVETEKLCPSGWHVPTDEEWKELEMYLGMSQIDADATGWRGTDEGGKLKETEIIHWNSPNQGATNESGFTALPGGHRHHNDGLFSCLNLNGYFWTSTNLWTRYLGYDQAGSNRGSSYNVNGFSIRCLKNNSPDIGMIPDTLDFGTTYTSTTEDSILSLWVKNIGDADLVIDSVKGLNEPFSHDFTISDTVIPDDSTEIQVALERAYIEGTYRDTLFIYNNAIDTFIVVKAVLEETDNCCPAAVMDYEGNVYPTVKIGSQCWLKENLKSIKYNDGTAITNVTDNTEWSNLTTEAYCWYDNDSATYADTYGALYNWYAVETEKLCPSGWHVPTDEEWKELEMYLGMSQSQADSVGWRGTDQGDKLKSTIGWSGGANGTNESGFTALPGGNRKVDGTYDYSGTHALFWTATEHSSPYSWRRILINGNSQVYRDGYHKVNGRSIRCLKNNPEIGLNTDTLDFGTMCVSTTEDSTLSLYVKNIGYVDLIIDSIQGLNEPFSHDLTTTETVIPDDSTEIQVTLERNFATGAYEDTLLIYSNATNLCSLNDGLLAYYPFNGNADDESGNGYHGDTTGHAPALTTDRFGNPNSAYSFDGVDDYILLTNTDVNRYFTISGWINRASGSGSSTELYSESTYWSDDTTGALNRNRISCYSYSGHFGFKIRTKAGNWNDFDRYAIKTSDTTADYNNKWCHVTYVRRNDNLEIYINGKKQSTTIIIDEGVNANQYDLRDGYSKPAYIGAYANDDSIAFSSPGIFDDIRIYNRALSESEIRALYGATPVIVKATLEEEPQPEITVNPDTLDFGTMFTSATEDSTLSVLVKNTGNADLIISNLIEPLSPFSTSFITPDTIHSGDSVTLEVDLNRDFAEGMYFDSLVIENNSPENVTVYLLAELIEQTPDLQIIEQPVNDTVCEGGTAVFGLVAEGEGLDYQWYFNDNEISQANDDTLILNDVLPIYFTYYYCMICDNNDSCIYSDTVFLIEKLIDYDLSDYNPDIVNDTLYFDVGGMVILNAGSNFDEYNWNTGQTTQIINVVDPGQYSVTVTDNEGCTADDTVTLIGILEVEINTTNANCNESDGSATAIAEGGILPYSYFWSNGDTTNNADSLPAGTHSLQVTDSTGNSILQYFVINNDNSPEIQLLNLIDAACYNSHDGEIEISVISGTEPYDIQWSNGDTTLIITDLTAGSYNVIVTDSNGCLISDVFSISQPEGIFIVIDTTSANCVSNDGSASATVSGGTAPYSYFWSTGSTENNIINLSAGAYSLTVTDANGCTKIKSGIDINSIGGPVIISDSITNTSCGSADGSIYVSVSGGSGIYQSYIWSDGNSNENLTNVEPGIYTLTVTDDSGCLGIYSGEVLSIPPEYQPICMVTVDSASGKNMIIWEKVQETGISHYNIYRETFIAGVYEKIDTVPYDSMSVYLDIESEPEQKAYWYKISSVDSCGNESELSDYHKTIHLTLNEGLGGVVNLIWDNYEGKNFYNTIYRYTMATGWDSLASVSSNSISYTDLDPPGSTKTYAIVAVFPDSCYTESSGKETGGPYSHSYSNLEETIPPSYTPYAGEDDEICGKVYQLNGSLSDVTSTGTWSGDAGVVFADENDPQTQVTVPAFGIYEFILTEENGMYSDLDNVFITFLNDSVVTGDMTGETDVAEGSTEQYYVNDNTGSVYQWVISGGTINTGQGSYIVDVLWEASGSGLICVLETNEFGCEGDTVCLSVTITGLDVLSDFAGMKIYPNPFTDKTTIEFSNPKNKTYTLNVINIMGQVVHIINDINTGKVILNRNNFAPGYYSVEIYGDKIYRGKIIIR